jgi:4a-hydroxytetrahydrobiopterin dehydratase
MLVWMLGFARSQPNLRFFDVEENMMDKKITDGISQLTEWQVVDDKLNRAFKFDNFVDAFAFMTKVAIIAEKMDHHPELFNVYNRVVIDLTTHDAGGIGALDIDLAQKIDAL